MGEQNATPNDQPAGPPANPTLGRRAGYHLDEHGNVTGIWFTVDVDQFIEFTDQAVVFDQPDVEPRQPGV